MESLPPDQPSPDPALANIGPATPPPNPAKPSSMSVMTVLGASLLIIPALCFGVAMPLGWTGLQVLLAVLWVIAAGVAVLVALVLVIRGLFSR